MLEQFLDNFTNSRVPTILFENVTVNMALTATGFEGLTELATCDSQDDATKLREELYDYIDKHIPVIAAPTLSITLGQDTNTQKVILNFVSKYEAVGTIYIGASSSDPGTPIRAIISIGTNDINLSVSIPTSD